MFSQPILRPHGLLCDTNIEQLISISPMHRGPCPEGSISYGLQSYGYDLRLGTKFKIFHSDPGRRRVIDPKKFDPQSFHDYDCSHNPVPVAIPGNGFALAEALESMEIPRGVLAIGIGKSTYARCGIILNVTPVEPEWRGKLTLEITNSNPNDVLVYPLEGICQLVFFQAVVECASSYQDKKGRYQDQEGLTLPRVGSPKQ